MIEYYAPLLKWLEEQNFPQMTPMNTETLWHRFSIRGAKESSFAPIRMLRGHLSGIYPIYPIARMSATRASHQ